MRRCLRARLFLVLLAVGVLWPVVALAISCGDCCESRTSACSIPATGFSVCGFHAASTLPDPPPSSFQPIESSRLAYEDETEAPPPDLQGILHVPRLSLI
ncbi:MAG TPA: hypothetical protein VNW71_03750 [Thermoanaerobaculia bacterium]|nr:hypothetical protein [Thermoanaerobaculia bacterium]